MLYLLYVLTSDIPEHSTMMCFRGGVREARRWTDERSSVLPEQQTQAAEGSTTEEQGQAEGMKEEQGQV